MVQFCPKCSSLLRRKILGGKTTLECKCGYTEEIEVSKEEIEKKIQEKKKALEKTGAVVLTSKDDVSVNLKVRAQCPKCGNMEAETWQVQTRSGDEPSTTFFKCTKCTRTWREY